MNIQTMIAHIMVVTGSVKERKYGTVQRQEAMFNNFKRLTRKVMGQGSGILTLV